MKAHMNYFKKARQIVSPFHLLSRFILGDKRVRDSRVDHMTDPFAPLPSVSSDTVTIAGANQPGGAILTPSLPLSHLVNWVITIDAIERKFDS